MLRLPGGHPASPTPLHSALRGRPARLCSGRKPSGFRGCPLHGGVLGILASHRQLRAFLPGAAVVQPRSEQSGTAALGSSPQAMSYSLWGAWCGCCCTDMGLRDKRACGCEQLRRVARPEPQFRVGVPCRKLVLIGFCLDETWHVRVH